MDIIRNNPYRILGVLSNASRKDIERNKSQIKAFAKVGRTPSFPYDFEESLVPVIRTEKSLNEAIGKLTFDKDKIAYGLFWFIETMPTDTMALDYLRVGNIDECINTFSSKSSYSTYISLGILYIIKRDWSSAIYWYARFWEYTPFYEKFVLDITNSSATIALDEELDVFTTNLINSFHSVDWLTVLNNTKAIPGGKVELGDWLIKSRLYASLAPKCVNLIKSKLDSYLEEASNVSRTDANANLSMAAKLEQSCKELLSSLKSTLGYDDCTYIRYADKVALQILDNCIYYYNNDQDNPAHPKNVLHLVRFCVKIAEDQLVKDRCKKNFAVIKEAYDNMYPQEIIEEVASIKKQMNRTYTKQDIVDNGLFLACVCDCHSKLNTILQKIGANDKYYWQLSEKLVLCYFNYIIDFIKNSMKRIDSVQPINYKAELNQLRKFLKKCQPILAELKSYPQKSVDSISYFNKNYKKFNELCIDYHVDELYKTPTNSKSIRWTKKEKWLIRIASILICILLTTIFFLIYNAPSSKKYIHANNSNTEQQDCINKEDISESYETTYFNTGDIPYSDIFGKGRYDKKSKNYIEISNEENTDAIVFLETLEGKKIRHVYICKNEKYKMKQIPTGKYIIKIMYGNNWNIQKYSSFGPVGGFMENETFYKSETNNPFVFPAYSSGKMLNYSITLNETNSGNIITEPISKGDFF